MLHTRYKGKLNNVKMRGIEDLTHFGDTSRCEFTHHELMLNRIRSETGNMVHHLLTLKACSSVTFSRWDMQSYTSVYSRYPEATANEHQKSTYGK